MLGTARAGSSHRALLADGPLRRVFLVSSVGRLGYALLPLCLLFSIADASGSFAVAATATAAFGVSGLAMPLQARMIDRFGQRRVLPVAGAWFSGCLVLAAVLAGQHVGSASAWVGLCAAGGLAAPSLGPSMRAQWRQATHERDRATAYSVDAVAEEGLFLAGPLAASGFLVAGPAWWGVVTAAALIPIGVLGLVASPHAPPAQAPAAGARPHWLGPFRQPGFRRLVTVVGAAGLVSSASLTLLAGEADRAGRPEVIGVVEAASGVASVLGALWWGRRARRSPWPRQLSALLALRVVPVLACLAHPTMATLAVAIVLTGFAAAPTFVVAYAASDRETDAHQHTEASTWVTSLNNIGVSLGTAAAGWLLAATSLTGALAGIVALLVLAAGAAARARARR